MQLGDADTGMRQGRRVLAIAHAVRHPIDTVVDAHTRAADNILEAEQSGHWFRASIEAGEIVSADAAAVVWCCGGRRCAGARRDPHGLIAGEHRKWSGAVQSHEKRQC